MDNVSKAIHINYTNYSFFVSYANLDNKKNGCIENLVLNVINKPASEVFSDPNNSPTIHFDKNVENMSVQDVYEQTKIRCSQSCVLFSFVSENYIKRPWCFWEWYFFYYRDNRNNIGGQLKQKAIIFIIVADMSPDFFARELAKSVDLGVPASEEEWQKVRRLLKDKCDESNTHEVIQKWIAFFSSNQSMDDVSTFGEKVNLAELCNNDYSSINHTVSDTFIRIFRKLKANIDKGMLKEKTKNFHVIYSSQEPYNEETLSYIRNASNYYVKKNSLTKGHRPVCVIYTGGTIGSYKSNLNTTSAHIAESMGTAKSAQELVQYLDTDDQSRANFDFNVGFISIGNPLDSADIEPKDWIRFAEIITKLSNSYQGFVILHGTNTLTYTAAALSYLLPYLDKPIVLTGSESPISTGSDALPNVLHSIRVAAIKSPKHHMRITESKSVRAPVGEVFIYFGRDLFRGNCTFRFRAEGDHSYKMHNIKELGIQKDDYFKLTYGNVINYKSHSKKGPEELEKKKLSLYYKKYLAVNINVISIYPGMEAVWDRSPENYHAFIFQGYTIGNLSTQATEWIKNIVSEKKALVAIATQCTEGASDWRGYEMNEATRYCINCGAMTLESSYTKLKWLIAVYMAKKNINSINATTYDKLDKYVKSGFGHSIRGEYGNLEAPKQQIR